jgi:hypothetical protein
MGSKETETDLLNFNILLVGVIVLDETKIKTNKEKSKNGVLPVKV